MPDFDFVGAAYQAPSIYQDAQECINWFPEIDKEKPDGARGVKALYPRPGLLAKVQLQIGEVRGMWVLPGSNFMLAVSGNALYSISSVFVATQVGTLLTSTGQVSITDNGISAYLVDGANRYYYTWTTNTFAVIAASDGAFVGGSRCDFVDGYVVYNQPGTNLWGCTNPLSTVSAALNFGSKGSTSDNLVALNVDHREVFLYGERQSEVWINVGSFPFPFQIIAGTTFPHGCAAKGSIAKLGESSAFLSQDARGQCVVIHIEGYTPRRISTHAVENDIMGGIITDAIAYTYQREGHEFYVLTLPTQDKTWVYDLDTEMWHKQAWRDSLNVLHRHRGNCAVTFQGLNLVGDWQNGLIYAMDSNTYTDNGNPILRMRRCHHLIHDLNRIYHSELQIQFQPGVGINTGQGSNPKMMLRWSNDGGSTWSQYYPISIGVMGAYKNRAIKRCLGEARDRIYEVTITDPIYAAVISANLVAEPGDS